MSLADILKAIEPLGLPPEKIYQRGDVLLLNANCIEVLPLLPRGCVDVLVTDPPYEITATGGGIGAKRQYLSDITGFTDCGFDYGLLSQFDNWACFGTLRQVPKLIESAGDRRWMLVTWNKPDPAPLCNGNYLPDTEYIIHAWRGKFLFGDCSHKSRFIVRGVNRDNGFHPNCKPVDVMVKVVRNASDSGHLVADIYAGSGTTGIACIQLGRKFFGCEVDPVHFATARDRLDDEFIRTALIEAPPPKATQTNLFNSA